MTAQEIAWAKVHEKKGKGENKKKGREKEESVPSSASSGPAIWGKPDHQSDQNKDQKDSMIHKAFTTTSAALFIALTKALDAYPEEEKRILKGAQTASIPFDVLEHDGYTTIKSTDATKSYTINGHGCSCPDPTSRCKHIWAKNLHRKMASIHKAMLAPENWWEAAVGKIGGVVHITENAWVFIPFGGPRGFFTNSSDCVLLTSGLYFTPSKPPTPTPQEDNERWEAAYYHEYNEIA